MYTARLRVGLACAPVVNSRAIAISSTAVLPLPVGEEMTMLWSLWKAASKHSDCMRLKYGGV